MAGRILTFEKLQGVVTLSAIYGYQRGLSDAIMDRSASETSEAQGEVLSDTISALRAKTSHGEDRQPMRLSVSGATVLVGRDVPWITVKVE